MEKYQHMSKIEYIIIQAGGKGTRLGQLTHNKPKGIVPVNNLPIIFHLFRQYSDKKFIVIGDYKHEVLEEYLESFCDAQYMTVKATGNGTCAGIKDAINLIPSNTPFMLVWSDLILDKAIDIDNCSSGNYIGISKDFECRWSFKNGECIEERSKEHGIAGLFIFQDKSVIDDVPVEGELVRWFSSKKDISFHELSLEHTREIGTIIAYEQNHKSEYTCRPFNRMEIKGSSITKIPIDAQGETLAVRERNWYREVKGYGFDQIPMIYSLEPLTMEKIDGVNIFRTDLTGDQKKIVIDNLVDSLDKLHGYKSVEADPYSCMEAYYGKTVKRLNKVRDLIPFANSEYITINGRKYKNPYRYKNTVRKLVKDKLCMCSEFVLIHGDCTFSNTMVNDSLDVTFLDPRGYFGNTEMYGDAYYDWAKLYYSVEGDYDRFNNKEFALDIDMDKSEVKMDIKTNGWRDVSEYLLSKISDCDSDRVKLIHAIIWLSLTTYAWEDYDSICGAFYKGTMLLDEFL